MCWKCVFRFSNDIFCFLWFTFLPLVTNLLHYKEAVNRGSSPQFTSSHPNTSWHLLPWLNTGMLISCNTLQRLFKVEMLGKAVTDAAQHQPAHWYPAQWSTLYAERLRRHRWNEGSLCALVLRLREGCLLQGSTARCRWTHWREGWEVVLGGGRRDCQANCRLWQLKRRRHRRHGNLTVKSLRSGCCVATAASVVICIWRVTSTVWHLGLEQTVFKRKHRIVMEKQTKRRFYHNS